MHRTDPQSNVELFGSIGKRRSAPVPDNGGEDVPRTGRRGGAANRADTALFGTEAESGTTTWREGSSPPPPRLRTGAGDALEMRRPSPRQEPEKSHKAPAALVSEALYHDPSLPGGCVPLRAAGAQFLVGGGGELARR